ncbi:MAG: adenylylsulfate kinase [Candidatus Paceibacteria bacterium]|jgi:adenylylsulfate kinase
MKDSRIRSVIKGLTWRAIATSTTMSLVYIATGDIELMAHVGMADVVIKLIFYYGHERAWGRLSWGRAVVRAD